MHTIKSMEFCLVFSLKVLYVESNYYKGSTLSVWRSPLQKDTYSYQCSFVPKLQELLINIPVKPFPVFLYLEFLIKKGNYF